MGKGVIHKDSWQLGSIMEGVEGFLFHYESGLVDNVHEASPHATSAMKLMEEKDGDDVYWEYLSEVLSLHEDGRTDEPGSLASGSESELTSGEDVSNAHTCVEDCSIVNDCSTLFTSPDLACLPCVSETEQALSWGPTSGPNALGLISQVSFDRVSETLSSFTSDITPSPLPSHEESMIFSWMPSQCSQGVPAPFCPIQSYSQFGQSSEAAARGPHEPCSFMDPTVSSEAGAGHIVNQSIMGMSELEASDLSFPSYRTFKNWSFEDRVQLPTTGLLHESISLPEMDINLILFEEIPMTPYEWSILFQEPSLEEVNLLVHSAYMESSIPTNVADTNLVKVLQPVRAMEIMAPPRVPVMTINPSPNADLLTTEYINTDFYGDTPPPVIWMDSNMDPSQFMEPFCGDMHMDVQKDPSFTEMQLRTNTMDSARDHIQSVGGIVLKEFSSGMQMVHAAPKMVTLVDAETSLVNRDTETAYELDLQVYANNDEDLSLVKTKLPVIAMDTAPDHLNSIELDRGVMELKEFSSYREMEVTKGTMVAIMDSEISPARIDRGKASEFDFLSITNIDWEYEKERIVLKMLGKRTDRKEDVEDEMNRVIQDFQNSWKDDDSSISIGWGAKKLRCFQRKITEIMNKYCDQEKRRVRYLPDFCKKALEEWVHNENHMESPYPDKDEICRLADELGLIRTQVEQWFENFRVRLWQPPTKGMRKGKFFRYPSEKTAILKRWILDHQGCPNPRGKDLEELKEKTEMTSPQIKQWCYNFRRRHKIELDSSSSRDDSKPEEMLPSSSHSVDPLDFSDNFFSSFSIDPSY